MQQRCPDNKALANPRDPFTSASIGGHSICSNIPCFHVRSREEEERSIGLLSLKIAFLLMNPKKKKRKPKKNPKNPGIIKWKLHFIGGKGGKIFRPVNIFFLSLGCRSCRWGFKQFRNSFPKPFCNSYTSLIFFSIFHYDF